MGTSTSSADLARKFQALADEIERRQTPAAKAGAQVVAKEVRRNVRQATGGDMILSGSTRTTARTRSGRARRVARVDVFTAPSKAVKGGSFVGMRGPAHLVENDIAKHYVFSRYARAAGSKRISRSVPMLGADGQALRTRAGKIRRRRIDTRAEAFGAGGAVGGDRRAVLNLGGGNFKRWTVAYSKGRKPWKRGVQATRGRAVRAMRHEEMKAVGAVFK